MMTLLQGLLVLSLSCLQIPCSTISPAGAMDLPSQQPVSEQAQQKLTPLDLLKLANQGVGDHAPLKRSLGDCKSTPTAEESRRLSQAMMAFTTDLFSSVAQTSTSSNLVLSPLSVALALAHLALGAQNQTLQSLHRVLHVDSGSCLPHLLSHLSQNLGLGTIRLAARIYLQKGFPIKDDFLEQSEKLFGAKPVKLTGRQEEDLMNINQWVKKATEGKIEDFLSELPDNTVLLLLNAIHFHGFWRTMFDSSLTQKDSFYLDEQFMVPVDMMHAQSYPLRWFLLEQPEIQVAHFPFKNNMSFVVMMPTHFKWNVSQVLANLSRDTLYQPSLREKPTKVQLPKLHLKQQLDLVATLSQLGLQELFQGPDLRGISDQSLVVSGVQHQSTMELSEAGVEAAAATSTAMTRMSISSFTVNRPFLFFIMDDTVGMPLFVGSVRNPNPTAQPQLREQQDSPDNRVVRKDKADLHGDKTFSPDLKLAPRLEEDYPQFSDPK
ncbi:alpha-2-antiplasmin isoform X2 [Meriones unguiculatus]|uniref:alpha-2-antiplasmin isoform X2 n=1 Tax=Meriones unguiculatus TaxID=10047 RepID=UPI00293F49A6|nr:alpha-2-antiplasmin isoform X2 [Meriones unguiculatus]XP_060243291.1 alpha-2-antiplasmin isoform X2 [Meriones unguiculatus]XP_060243292.1 alpha-2-antiplasmin isoform X2 [Meriones unguiculatus]XP_060243293.1 alpha-2-antiplasmin isoform X2 [Meriones unguiculatus]